ncbi:TANK-binding kinase 1-binding protein 1 [Ambystoma mexicanum]|uniref:TANK-binding kinase 1-binding protein 1 n=1 Tax=Ambystoma mexicanum TaxID=8296 RepID=UPI0037E912A3
MPMLSLAMDSMFEDDITIIAQETLCQDEEWIDSPNTDLSSEMCSASHFALITAYDDIKDRLTGLERENSTLRRKLKLYEVKYPLITQFEEDHNFSVYDTKDSSLEQKDVASLQEIENELQKSTEREEQLEEMIQAYEKVCAEKAELQVELSEMRDLVESHMDRIQTLEQQLRQRENNSFQALSSHLQSSEVQQYLSLHGSAGLTHVLDRSLGWQSSRSLDEPNALRVQSLEAELAEVRRELQSAQCQEEQLKEDCESLRTELKQLQKTREQELASSQSEREVAWLKKVGDDQVNLALAYTELTEELSRLRTLSSLQGQILRTLLQEQNGNTSQRHSPALQRHSPGAQRLSPAPQCQSPAQQRRSPGPQSPAQQRRSPVPQCQSPAQQRRSPAPQCQSPIQQRRSPAPLCHSPVMLRGSPSSFCQSPTLQHRSAGGIDRSIIELGYSKPSTHHIKASFQGRRSYSEVADAGRYQQTHSLWLSPDAPSLPKHPSYNEVYIESLSGPPSPRELFEENLPFDKQSSDDDDWTGPSPPSPDGGAIRCASFCAGFPIPNHRIADSYSRAEHAQSWPSINLLMETVDSDIRSCPLCQVAFPMGYPDDALIKHIDSHLENSKI